MENKNLNRREFIRMNAAVLGGGFLTPALSGKKMSQKDDAAYKKPSTGFYRFNLGDVNITVFSDGYFHFPMELLVDELNPYVFLASNADPDDRASFFSSRLVPDDHVPLQASPVLIESGDRRFLVDAGWGDESPPTVGILSSAMEILGIPPESIDMVILTHAHPDHLGGLVNPATGNLVYPNAEVVLSETELAFWESDDPVLAYERILDIEAVINPARSVLGALHDRIRTVGSEQEITSGIHSLLSPGHTPGHMSLLVESGDKTLLIVGDSIVFTHVSFEYPEWNNYVDIEHTTAAQSRRKQLDRAASDKMLILGYHFPFPGIGYALRYGDAYRWHPAGWNVLQ